MTLNELMIRHNFISKILLRDGDKELNRSLKVKVMSMRIEMGKVRKQLEEDLQEFVKELTSGEYQEFMNKPDKTPEEQEKANLLNNKVNEEYNEYLDKRGKEEVEIKYNSFTEEEFSEILEVNAGNDVEINGTKLNAADFLEVLYSLFVE